MLLNELNEPAVVASLDGAAIARSLSSPEAFTEIFERHFAAVHRYLARRAGRDRADDLASQAFLVAFQRRSDYREGLGSARPWLLGIATNLLREDHRSEQRVLTTITQLSNEVWVSGTRSADGELGEDDDLANALVRLDAGQRDALLLHIWGELSYAEIAKSLDIPIGTVRSRIFRACASLRTELRQPPAGDASTIADQEER